MTGTHIRFKDSDGSEYEPSDSEDDYTEKEKKLLHKMRSNKRAESDEEDEVYGVESEEHSEGDKSDIALSDVEGQEQDDLPDVRAWGKDKRKFYSTDYVDPDYGGFQGKDAILAEIEEEEAKNLQKQLAQQLDDGDFSLEMFVQKNESQNKEDLEIIKTDVNKLSKLQKLQLLRKESPEFFELIEDFKVKLIFIKDVLKPVLELSKKGNIEECDALFYLKFYYLLILNYCTNIAMYLLLKDSKVNLKNHSIAKRLFQYRQHIAQMEGVFKEIKPQVEILLNLEESDSSKTTTNKKTLKLLSELKKAAQASSLDEAEQPPKKRSKSEPDEKLINKTEGELNQVTFTASNEGDSDVSLDMQEDDKNNIDEAMEITAGDKRAITYQMAKNKGLTPHRKKEQKNPRVKHRNKFRKAKIRRRGAVREVRKELSRYGGEISGIKASVTKSIKIK